MAHPKFGHEEVMKRFGVKESPMLVAIIKPSLGENLRINDIEEKIEGALAGGFHAVKDDEMQGDLLFAPLQDRLQLAKKSSGTFLRSIWIQTMRMRELYQMQR